MKIDWGLFDKSAGENKYLREEIVYTPAVSSRESISYRSPLHQLRFYLKYISKIVLECFVLLPKQIAAIFYRRRVRNVIIPVLLHCDSSGFCLTIHVGPFHVLNGNVTVTPRFVVVHNSISGGLPQVLVELFQIGKRTLEQLR